ncbi:MAG: manganese efflux pump [Candidatus Methanomethylophilaceae archaeon]|nr:manganese efflux pump [Candidatus Methanomethylophilaceae archaeon]
MDPLSVILIAIGLAMDAFAVSICKGLAMKKPDIRAILIIGIWFGGFQGLMPIIGYYLGESFYQYIADIDHWVAFSLLLIIGLNMIREALFEDEEDLDDNIGFRIMLLLAIATSIDALAVGISLAMEGGNIWADALVIGVITMVISMAGVKLGSIVGNKFSKEAELTGGVILILIGLKILLEGLDIL